jgi:hypothetical protein
VAGGLLQVGGVLVLVLGVILTHRRVEAYRKTPTSLDVHDSAIGVDSGTPALTTVAEPTLEERVGRLEVQVGAVRDELGEAAIRLRQTAQTAADAASESASRRASERFEAIERLILGETRIDRWVRVGSIVAVILGVILATIGSVAP